MAGKGTPLYFPKQIVMNEIRFEICHKLYNAKEGKQREACTYLPSKFMKCVKLPIHTGPERELRPKLTRFEAIPASRRLRIQVRMDYLFLPGRVSIGVSGASLR